MPPTDKSTKPPDIAIEENTPIVVSVDVLLLFFTIVISIENTMEKQTAESTGFKMPNMLPIATPVNAPWPNASEKKAILLLTIIVPSIPKIGEIIRMASNAFFMKFI
ncbi:MAG: hypothetical protein BWY74_04247 [Firmicutes bacterium ADurb.Bin419]|nr:MAG: hypothetical protein BWY74_04247 [Firmicutes bacterium ADurb.Bin419]